MTGFVTHNEEAISGNGTSFKGYLPSTLKNLVDIFGEPFDGDGDKTNFEWAIRFDDGTIATIYDWKSTFSPLEDEKVVWHVGGFRGEAIDKVDEIIKEAADPEFSRGVLELDGETFHAFKLD